MKIVLCSNKTLFKKWSNGLDLAHKPWFASTCPGPSNTSQLWLRQIRKMDTGEWIQKGWRLFSPMKIASGNQWDNFLQIELSTYFSLFFFVITNITYFNLEMKGNSLWHYLRSCLLALPFVSVVWFTCKENHEPRLIIWFSSSLNCSKIWESGGHTYLRTWRQIESLKSSNSSTSSIWPSFKKVRENGLGLKFLFPLVDLEL